MPYTIIWEPGGVLKRFHGFLTGPELVAAAQAVAGDRRFDELRYIINDLSEVDGSSIDASAIEDYASMRIGAAYSRKDILSPFVFAGEPGATLVALLQTRDYANAHPIRAFAALGEARHWLEAELLRGEPGQAR